MQNVFIILRGVTRNLPKSFESTGTSVAFSSSMLNGAEMGKRDQCFDKYIVKLLDFLHDNLTVVARSLYLILQPYSHFYSTCSDKCHFTFNHINIYHINVKD